MSMSDDVSRLYPELITEALDLLKEVKDSQRMMEMDRLQVYYDYHLEYKNRASPENAEQLLKNVNAVAKQALYFIDWPNQDELFVLNDAWIELHDEIATCFRDVKPSGWRSEELELYLARVTNCHLRLMQRLVPDHERLTDALIEAIRCLMRRDFEGAHRAFGGGLELLWETHAWMESNPLPPPPHM